MGQLINNVLFTHIAEFVWEKDFLIWKSVISFKSPPPKEVQIIGKKHDVSFNFLTHDFPRNGSTYKTENKVANNFIVILPWDKKP